MREIARNLGYLILHTLNPGANGAADYGVGVQSHVCGGVIARITYLCRTFLALYVVKALVGDSTDFTLHYILCIEKMITFLSGDCLEVMRDLSAGSIDCFVCDLPYGCLHAERANNGSGSYGAQGKMIDGKLVDGGCSWDIKLNLAEFWTQVKRLAKNDHTPVLMFCTTKFGYDLIQSNPSWFRYDLVWNKERGVSFLSANKMPMRSHEMIYVFSKKGAYYNRVDEDAPGKPQRKDASNPIGVRKDNFFGNGMKRSSGANENKACPKSVIHIQKVGTHKHKHPTEKPIALYKWLLERYCPEGGTILDPTAGSFNSCFAAREMGLHAIGIEKDPTFYQKAASVDASANVIVHIQ